MGFKIIRRGDEEQETEASTNTGTITEPVLEKVETPDLPLTPFKQALNAEKENLTKRIGELEGALQGAREQIKSGTEKKESIAQEAEDIARRMKAIDAMSKIY